MTRRGSAPQERLASKACSTMEQETYRMGDDRRWEICFEERHAGVLRE